MPHVNSLYQVLTYKLYLNQVEQYETITIEDAEAIEAAARAPPPAKARKERRVRREEKEDEEELSDRSDTDSEEELTAPAPAPRDAVIIPVADTPMARTNTSAQSGHYPNGSPNGFRPC